MALTLSIGYMSSPSWNVGKYTNHIIFIRRRKHNQEEHFRKKNKKKKNKTLSETWIYFGIDSFVSRPGLRENQLEKTGCHKRDVTLLLLII